MSDYIEQFSNEVCNRIGYYVYRLIDPRNGQTFYVGQGKGNRVFAHVNRQVKTRKEEDSESLKLKTIRQINNCGLKVIHVIHRWGLTEKEARIVESAVMDCYPGITNIQSGYQSDKGVTSAYELQNRLSLEEYVEPTDLKYVIIKIKQNILTERNEDIYETARRAWRISLNTVKQYKYALAVLNGVVVGVYEVDKWCKSFSEPNRVEFFGHKASKNIEDIFLRKLIPSKYIVQGMASPVLYSKN